MERFGDLPAHPLIVHFPVVMVPLLTVLTLLMAFRPSARRALSGYCALAGIGTLAATVLAASSGEALAEVFDQAGNYEEIIADHRGLGEWLRLFVLVFALLLIATWWLGRRSDRDPTSVSRSVVVTVTALTVVVALSSTAWVYRTGHSGAKTSWGNALPTSAVQDGSP